MASGSSPGRRAAAVASIPLAVAGVLLLAFGLGDELVRILSSAALVLIAIEAAWFALTRSGWRSGVAAMVGVAAVVALILVTLFGTRTNVSITLAGVASLAAAGALARRALGRDVGTLGAEETAGARVRPAARPVLLVNPRSGGGKAGRFGLVDACRARGIEPIVLSPGDDLRSLAREAIDRGADAIGMAGGDGSQGIVASVASARDVPMVVVPAGTRNHLALDLGLDPRDVVGALQAFGEAAERRIDLGEVNGRFFVNNVSLGVYAAIVRSPEYRDAKVETTLSTLHSVLGPGTAAFDLSFRGPDGDVYEGAHVVQVSNNPYGTTAGTSTRRSRLDTHRLGVMALAIEDDRGPIRFLAALAAGHPERYEGFVAWAPETFDVRSREPVEAGLDGESTTFDPPLSFSIRPGALRVRLPLRTIRVAAERRLDARSAARRVWRIALGRPQVVA